MLQLYDDISTYYIGLLLGLFLLNLNKRHNIRTKFKRPKVIGELKVIRNKAGSLSIWNGIKKGGNKIMIPCRDETHAKEVIQKLLESEPNDTIYF